MDNTWRGGCPLILTPVRGRSQSWDVGRRVAVLAAPRFLPEIEASGGGLEESWSEVTKLVVATNWNPSYQYLLKTRVPIETPDTPRTVITVCLPEKSRSFFQLFWKGRRISDPTLDQFVFSREAEVDETSVLEVSLKVNATHFSVILLAWSKVELVRTNPTVFLTKKLFEFVLPLPANLWT